MSAVQVFHLPDLGEGLTEAELVTWLVAVGDEIGIDQAIAEVETAKSTVELPSPYAGTVMALHGTPGELLQVGAPVLEVSDGSAPAAAPAAPAAEGAATPEAAPAAPAAPQEPKADAAASGNVLIGYGTSGHGSANRRRRAPLTTPVREARPRQTAPTAVRSPIVRRLARDLGVDVTAITPTGADGAITRDDVVRAASGTTPAHTAPTAVAPVGTPPGLSETGRERMSMLRRSASATFVRSRTEIPEATVWVDVDVTDLWAMRTAMATETEKAPSFTALLARFVVIALGEYPLLASRLSADASEIITFDGVNLGIAADTTKGLLVPVISHAERLTLAELDDSLRATATDARSGALPPQRLSGSTFTLNNYGAFGVDGSAAIINYPEVAILGAGRALERPWVVNGEITVRRIVQLSLVFDHRVCDGGYASGFLSRVVSQLEAPLSAYRRI